MTQRPAGVMGASRLENLGRRYKTDKMHSAHGYLSLYSILFSHLTDTVVNLTEIGLFNGASALMWTDFFPRAHIFGIEKAPSDVLRERLQARIDAGRITLLQCDSTDPQKMHQLFAKETMDIIIDDGAHDGRSQQITLASLWYAVRPGGLYIIEDVLFDHRHRMTSGCGEPSFIFHRGDSYGNVTREILRQHDVFVADTLTANFNSRWWSERTVCDGHDSHAIVIRKRETIESGD